MSYYFRDMPRQAIWNKVANNIDYNFLLVYQQFLKIGGVVSRFCGLYPTASAGKDAISDPVEGMYFYSEDTTPWSVWTYDGNNWSVTGTTDGSVTVAEGGGGIRDFEDLSEWMVFVADVAGFESVDKFEAEFASEDEKMATIGAITKYVSLKIAALKETIKADHDLRYLRKDIDDSTTHTLKMGGAEVEGSATVFGSLSAKGGAVFGTPAEAPGGVGTINGGTFDADGNIRGRSLELSEFLEVPEIRFNRASLVVGTSIQSPCAGIIRTVTPIDKYTGIATLELGDDDIAGSIQEGALCWGYFHDITHRENNASASSDDRKGNIEYHGFATVYFQIAHIFSPADKDDPDNIYSLMVPDDCPNNSSVFLYELREGYHLHPYPAMNFGGRGNSKDTNLQGFTIKTPDYEATYQNVGSWDWSDLAKYVVKVQGKLDGFESLAGMKPGVWKNHYGTIETNLYYRGELKSVDLRRAFLFVTLASNGMIEEGETEEVTILIRNQAFGIATSAFDIYINEEKQTVAEGAEDLMLRYAYADLPDELNRFSVRCVDKVGILPTLEGSFSIRKLAPRSLRIETNMENDPFIDNVAPRTVVCRVLNQSNVDVTDKVTSWSITRESSDPDADAIWAQRQKVKDFAGTIDIYWSMDASVNDLDLSMPTTKFRITAVIDNEPISLTLSI